MSKFRIWLKNSPVVRKVSWTENLSFRETVCQIWFYFYHPFDSTSITYVNSFLGKKFCFFECSMIVLVNNHIYIRLFFYFANLKINIQIFVIICKLSIVFFVFWFCVVFASSISFFAHSSFQRCFLLWSAYICCVKHFFFALQKICEVYSFPVSVFFFFFVADSSE